MVTALLHLHSLENNGLVLKKMLQNIYDGDQLSLQLQEMI